MSDSKRIFLLAKEAPMEHEDPTEASLWQQLPGKSGEARAEILLELAKQAIYRSQGAEALALTEEAHGVYQELGALAPTSQIINSIMGISHSLQSLNLVPEAVATIDKVIELQRSEGFPFVVDSLRVKAAWLRESAQFDAAIAAYLECVQINEVEGDHQFLGHDLYAVGHCYRKLEQWQAALDHFERARVNFKIAKMFDEVAWCDAYIADAYAELNQAEVALDLANRTLGFAEIRNAVYLKCITNLALGKAFTLLCKVEAAESALYTAKSLLEDSKEWDVIRRIEVALLNLYQTQGDLEKSEVISARLKAFDEIVDQQT